jgi:hypothetical protein
MGNGKHKSSAYKRHTMGGENAGCLRGPWYRVADLYSPCVSSCLSWLTHDDQEGGMKQFVQATLTALSPRLWRGLHFGEY